MKLKLCFLLCLFFGFECISQNPKPSYKNFTVDNGLPSSEVYYSIQDRNGFIWFSTDRGIVKYDGYQFTTFTTSDGLTDNVVFDLYEDYKGRIWVIPMNGKLCYIENDTITTYKYNDLIYDKIRMRFWFSFYVDSQDNIYFGTSKKGLIIISSEGVLSYFEEFSDTLNIIKYAEINGNLLAYGVANDSVYNYSPKVLFDYYYQDDPLICRGPSKRTKAMKINANLVINDDNTVFIFDKFHKLQDEIKFDSEIVHISKTKDMLVVGTLGEGLFLYKIKEGKFYLNQHLLEKYTCSSFLLDNTGGFWITTTQQGVFYTPGIEILSYDSTNGLVHDYIYKLEVEDGVLWFSYIDSIQKLDSKFITVEEEVELDLVDDPSLRDGICFLKGCFLCRGKMKMYDLCKGTATFRSDQYGNVNFAKWEDQLFISFRTQVLKYSPEKVDLMDLNIDGSHIEDLLAIGKDSLWVGSLDGLYLYSPSATKYYGESHAVLSSRIVALDQSSHYDLIVATRGEGIVLMKDDQLKVINMASGLYTNEITSLYVDSLDNIWAATNEGLHMIKGTDPNDIMYFSVNDGLISNEITDVRRIKNEIFVATKAGLSIIDLQKYTENIASVKIALTAMRLDDIALDLFSEIEIVDGGHSLEVEYFGMDFRSVENIEYRYRLKTELMEYEWNYTDTNKFEIRTPDQEGKYEVEISARVKPNRSWGENNTIATFTVEETIYKNSLFLLFSMILGLLIIGFGIKADIWTYRKHVVREVTNRILRRLGRKAYIIIEVDKVKTRIECMDILYIQSFRDYIEINTKAKKYLYRSTLKNMEKQITQYGFIRIHRSYIANINKIDSIAKNRLMINDVELPIW